MKSADAHDALRRELGEGFADWHISEGDAAALAELDGRLKQAPPGEAMMNWMRLEKLRAFPSEALLEAGRASHDRQIDEHIAVLSSHASPLEVYALAPRGHDAAALAEYRLWLNAGSYPMRSLALMRAVRTLAYACYRWGERGGAGQWARQRLHSLADDVGGPDHEKALLWWQVWGGLARFRMREGRAEIDEAIRDICRTQIVQANASKLPPKGVAWAAGNGSWESLLLEVATEVPHEARQELVDVFLVNIERRLRGEPHARPNLNMTEGLWTTNAFVWALVCQFACSRDHLRAGFAA